MILYFLLLCSPLRDALRTRQQLLRENLALRQQLAVLSRQRGPPRLRPADRLFWSWLSRPWSCWRSALVLMQPETVVRWQRTAWRHYWAWRSRRAQGRPRIPREVRDVIRRLARENPRWGSMRIVGELRKLGYHVSAQTVRRYRREAMHRPPSQSWQTFLRNHAPHICAADFFTVQTLTLKTLHVFCFISHCRRRLVHLNVTAHPTADWVWRQLIEATPWGEQPKHLIRDTDCCYGGSFNGRAARLGVQAIITPVQAPRANAVAQRVVGTLRRECLDHMLVLGERHLRRLLREYVAHYNAGRPHRSLGLETRSGPPDRASPPLAGVIIARPVPGGLQHECEWAAATEERGGWYIGTPQVLVAADQGMEGLTAADFLGQEGKEVEVLVPEGVAGAKAEGLTKTVLLGRLSSRGVVISTRTGVRSIEGDKVVAFDAASGNERRITGVDTVVLALGSVANDALLRALDGQGWEVHAIGQCRAPGRMLESALDGLRVGRLV